ncbi:MAG: class C sortase [Clostridiales bacterium]|nr:class C sortase [Clostridiales bacterium]
MNKSKVMTVFLTALFVLGAFILIYPAAADRWASQFHLHVIEDYQSEMDDAAQQALAQEEAAATDYNERLLRGNVSAEEYSTLLSNTEVMAYLEIPVIGVELPIYHGADDDTLSRGIGHLQGSSLPTGGTGTHCALSAHCGMPQAQLFTGLEKLTEGDRFYLHALGKTLTYQVDQIRVVLPTDTSLLAIDPQQDYVTLVTCTPYAVNTHRLLVRGVRVPDAEAEVVKIDTTAPPVSARRLSSVEVVQYISFFVGSACLVLLGILLIRSRRRAKS